MRVYHDFGRGALLCAAAFVVTALGDGSARAAAPVAIRGYQVGVFAVAPAGMSAPDSIVLVKDKVWVGFGDGAAKDGSSGSSTVVEFDLRGHVLQTVTIAGHNDGLRVNPKTGKLVALQNEDANPTEAAIDPQTGAVTAPISLPSVNGGGGYDDLAFIGQAVYASASNPTLNGSGINPYPAILTVKPSNAGFRFERLLKGDAHAYNVVTKADDTLNLTDPDSLTVTPTQDLLMTDQADAQLILVRVGAGKGPRVTQIPLAGGVQVDDTVFATATRGTIFVSDTAANTIYALSSKLYKLDKPYSASTGVPATKTKAAVPAFVGSLDLAHGKTSPILTGLNSPHGMAFYAGSLP